MFAGIVETQFAEYLSSLTDVPATLETTDRDSAGKVMLMHCLYLLPSRLDMLEMRQAPF